MSEFTEAVDNGCKGFEDVYPGDCEACGECDQFSEEGHFSWSSCDLCGSTLGGQRYPAHANIVRPSGVENQPLRDLIHLEICVDCTYYLANGEEPEAWRAHR